MIKNTLITKVFAFVYIFIAFKAEAFAQGYDYERIVENSKVMHILKIDPKYFEAKLVRANDGKLGREKVSSIAERTGAKIAINSGFFDIGGKRDGFPSGTLIIDGNDYKIRKKDQPLVIINDGKININYSNPVNLKKPNLSMVSGMPMLIKNGELFTKTFKYKADFYSKPHARTAIGIDKDNKIVIVVVEHSYLKDLNEFTMGELTSLMNEKRKLFLNRYKKNKTEDLTLKELKDILKKEFTPDNGIKGLTIEQLANFMKELGCVNALNLDGGGSSSLWVENKIVNNTVGDVDEARGIIMERPVSDAIVFTKSK